MKLTLLGPTYPFRGGIAQYTTQLYFELEKSHQVKLLTFRRQYPGWLFPGRSDRDPSTIPFTAPSEPTLDPLNPLTWITTIRKVLRCGSEALILQWWVAYWAPSFWTITQWVRRRNVRVLFICHNVSPHEPRRFNQAITRTVLSKCDGLIVTSAGAKEQVASLLPQVSVRVAPLPTISHFPLCTTQQSVVKASLGLATNCPLLLFFGFVRDYKGLTNLLNAMALVLRRQCAHLLIAGEFWEPRQAYEREIAVLGIGPHVTIIDRYIPNEEVSCIFAACDLVVLPYVSATGSAVAQLALAQGCPVIGTNTGGIPEAIQDNVNGRLVESGDVDALANAIVASLSPDQLSLFRDNIARQQADRRFGWGPTVRAIEDLCMTSFSI